MANKLILKRIFLFLFLIFSFTLVVLYIDETRELINSPYLTQIKNIIRNSQNESSYDSTSLHELPIIFSDSSTKFYEPPTSNLEPSTALHESLPKYLKPSTTFNKSIILSSIEENWTYECSKNRCIRKFHGNIKEERITFLSCSLTCGIPKIWPKPLKSIVKKSTERFNLANLKFQVKTQFSIVAELLDKSVTAFTEDLKQIIFSYGENIDNNYNEAYLANITSVVISMHVTESDATLLTLTTDECYTLSIICKFVIHPCSLKFTARTIILIILDSNYSVNVIISGKTFFGARHGLETLQQLIWYDDNYKSLKIFTDVTIEDCPSFK